MKIKPKYIKKANMWLVHLISKGQDKKEIHKMEWFDSEKNALEFYNQA